MKRKRGDPKYTTSLAIFKRALKLLAIPLALVLATAPMPSSAEEEVALNDAACFCVLICVRTQPNSTELGTTSRNAKCEIS